MWTWDLCTMCKLPSQCSQHAVLCCDNCCAVRTAALWTLLAEHNIRILLHTFAVHYQQSTIPQSCFSKGIVISQAGIMTTVSLWWYFLQSPTLLPLPLLNMVFSPGTAICSTLALYCYMLLSSSVLPYNTGEQDSYSDHKLHFLQSDGPFSLHCPIRLAQYTQPFGLACRSARSNWQMRKTLTMWPLRLDWQLASVPLVCTQTWKQCSRSWLTQ